MGADDFLIKLGILGMESYHRDGQLLRHSLSEIRHLIPEDKTFTHALKEIEEGAHDRKLSLLEEGDKIVIRDSSRKLTAIVHILSLFIAYTHRKLHDVLEADKENIQAKSEGASVDPYIKQLEAEADKWRKALFKLGGALQSVGGTG